MRGLPPLLLLLAGLLAGCSTSHPWINQPLTETKLVEERVEQGLGNADDLSMLVAVTLSGGGARAAAFGYGVLQEMRASPVQWNGRRTTLLDEVDVISGVSGGSILATYYAAFGSQTFPRFEEEFLRQDFQQSLISNVLRPASLYELTSPWFGRGHLLARRLDALYQGKTFADLGPATGGPRLLVSATDLSLGSSFEFTWEQFALICSDLGSVPLSFAVASSSAVPIALSPLTLKNYAGDCKFPAALTDPTALRNASDYRARMLASQARSYRDAQTRPYIHLVDGGLADNLGVRSLLERSLAGGGLRGAMRTLPKGSIRKLVLVTVNSERDPSERIDASDKVPSTLQVFDALLFGAGSRATRETEGLLADMARLWRNELKSAAPGGEDAFAPDAQIYVISVNLRDAPEALERNTLMLVPTAFSLPRADVDRLIEAGRRVLRDAPEYKALLKSLPAAP